MASTVIQLLNLISSKVLSGGRKTTAANTRQVLNEIANSSINLLDDQSIDGIKTFNDLIKSNRIESYTNSNSNIQLDSNVARLSSNVLTQLYAPAGYIDLYSISNISIRSVSGVSLVSDPTFSIDISNNGYYAKLTTNSLTADRFFQFPDNSGTIALISDVTAAVSTAEAYADSLVVGLWDDRGNFDASVNAYPSSGGSGTAGAILKGDIWTVSVGGTLPTAQVVNIGDTVRALVNTPGNTQANWAIAEGNLGYVPVTNARTLTINGTAFDLSANRSWTVGDALLGTANVFTATNNFSGLVGIGSTTPVASLDITENVTSNAWTTNGIGLRVRANTYTDLTGSGDQGVLAIHSLLGSTVNATNAISASTSFATLYIQPPVNGTNVTGSAQRAIYATGAIQSTFALYSATIGRVDNGNLAIITNNITRLYITNVGQQTHTMSVLSSGTTPFIAYTQPVHTGGAQPGLLWTAGALTSQTTATEVVDIKYNLGAVLKSVDGIIPVQRSFVIIGRTYTPQTTALTITNSSVLDVTQSLAGSGTTITNNYTQRWLYDASNYIGVNVNSGGGATFTSAGTGIKGFTFSGGPSRFDGTLILTSNTLLGTAVAGTKEFNGNFYNTNTSLVRYGLGGTIKDFFADVATTTSTAETDIYTYTTMANTLNVNGDKIDAEYGLQLTSTGGITKQLRAYFAGTLIFDSGALSISASTDFIINILVIRDSATTVRCIATANTTGAATNAYAKVTKVTGLTLSNTNILKVTATVGTGAVAGDATGICGMVEVKAAA